MEQRRTTCFVIMPFNEKKDVDGKVIDFNRVYETVIKAAVSDDSMRAVGGPEIDCLRCDEIAESGWIHRIMVSHIYNSDVAIVDLSTLNPNVFYELGVRHALRRAVTVLMCRKGTKTPFNVSGFNYISYDPDDEGDLQAVRTQIAKFVAVGLKTLSGDSLVYEVLEKEGWEGPPPMFLRPGPRRLFRLKNVPDVQIGIVTGGLEHVNDIDIWVNSENTNMQMPGFSSVPVQRSFATMGQKETRPAM